MWYDRVFRRHLCDMHIDDWDERFLSEFSPEEYVENLKTADVQNAMIPLQSHVGLCYYPTKIGIMHKSFSGREDMIRRVVDLCHENNITVIGYYSLNFNNVEHDRHTNWRMINSEGLSMREGGRTQGQELAFASVRMGRYGLCCPNNKEYREFVYRQIDEMTDYFNCDGYFFDMPFWKHTCYCECCKEKWENEVGGEMPIEPTPGTDAYLKLLEKKHQWMGEWIQSVTDYVKSINMKLTVSHNFAPSIAGSAYLGCGEEVNTACDYVGGDLYGGNINHSFACKFYKNVTKNMPFEYMFSRCKPALRAHTLTKTFDEMKTEIMITAAHHGATLVIDAIDPVGTMDKRVYGRIGAVFDFEKKYEKYFDGVMCEDVGLYYSSKSRFNVRGEPYNVLYASMCISETLIAHNILFGVTGPTCDIEKYKMLIIPCSTEMEAADADRIASYVKNGGSVYISGADNPLLLKKLLDGEVVGRTEEENTYISPCNNYENVFEGFNSKYPLPYEGTAPIVRLNSDCEIFAKVTLPYTKPSETEFSSIHSDPPGIETDYPAVVIKKYGKGVVIWAAQCIEAVDIYEYRNIFMNLVYKCINADDLLVKSNASEDVELTVFKTDEGYNVNLVCISEKPKAEIKPSFDIKIKMSDEPENVFLLPEMIEIPFEYDGVHVCFKTRELDVFDMYMVKNK